MSIPPHPMPSVIRSAAAESAGALPAGAAGLIDRIYEAAAVPELWRQVLADLARFAGAPQAVMVVTSWVAWSFSAAVALAPLA